MVGAPVADPLLKAGIDFPKGLAGYREGARFDELLLANMKE
jgi:hypothetical protein